MKNTKGYIYSIIGAILFGTAGLFVKFAYSTGLGAVSLLTVQYIIAVILMFLLAFVKNKKTLKVSKNQLRDLAILGIIGNTFMTVFYYMCFEYLPVAMVTMLLYTYPIIVFIYTTVFNKHKVRFRKFIALLLAFIGCILTLNLISGKFNYSLKGIIIGLLSAVFYAFMNIFTEKKLSNVEPLTINAYSTLFSLASLCLYSFPTFLFRGEVSVKGLIYIVNLAFFCEIIPLTLLYASISYIGALKVSIISNLEIPTSMIVGLLFLGERVSIMQIIGAICIIYAVYLLRE
ncbi:MAG: protein of unknown function transrane [Clostridiaceae bacterium]|nr:protein of unknown function transrane [Clostridiaceae bacterium]